VDGADGGLGGREGEREGGKEGRREGEREREGGVGRWNQAQRAREKGKEGRREGGREGGKYLFRCRCAFFDVSCLREVGHNFHHLRTMDALREEGREGGT